MNVVFQIVSRFLLKISAMTGFTYNEVNIIAYYIVLPFVYVALADRILKRHVLKICYAVAIAGTLLAIRDFRIFSDWLFDESVGFLLSFRAIGWNYIVASVMVCVVFPAAVFLGMLHLAYLRLLPAVLRRTTRRNWQPS